VYGVGKKKYLKNGDNEKGWRVYCEDWGKIDSDDYAFLAIKPAYIWYGK